MVAMAAIESRESKDKDMESADERGDERSSRRSSDRDRGSERRRGR